jgi:lipoprotein-releasing system ATP-binding protein
MDDKRVGLRPLSDESALEPLIKVRNLSKGFKDINQEIRVLNKIDFDLYKGETVSIVGASGIGKSTFLHLLGALDYPDDGALIFNGEDVFGFDDAKLARFRNRSIGFVFQFHHLLPDFTAIENVMMPALISGTNTQNAADAAQKILVRVGLKDRLNHRIGKLSGGEQQRVAIARALVLSPMILLADEPTGNLDKKNGDRVHELLLTLNQELQMALVIVTHNLELASYTSRKMTIADGNLVELN